ncbi:MAG: hypothetical protein ACFE9L_12525 [Candidatus Hodarchaeota archaeon]
MDEVKQIVFKTTINSSRRISIPPSSDFFKTGEKVHVIVDKLAEAEAQWPSVPFLG